MKLIKENVSINELKELAKKNYGNLVKAVIDIEKKLMMIDSELHSDLEEALLESGSEQKNLWGINLHPEESSHFLEFDSMINLRPAMGNVTRSIDDSKTQEIITSLISKLVKR